MARATQTEIPLRIVIEHPVTGVHHSLQAKDGKPLDPKCSKGRRGARVRFRGSRFAVRVAPGPKFFGDQVRREGLERRFVYIRVGQMAGDAASIWSRTMKIDIHDIEPSLLKRAASGNVLEISVNGTAKDGAPACATLKPCSRRIAQR